MYWTVKDSSGSSGNLIGGATFQLQGPRTSSSDWGTSYTVTDCTSSPCTGLDRDPDPGEFQVANGSSPTGVAMAKSQRWQLTPASSPSTWTYNGAIYRFTTTAAAQMAANALASGTYSFGNFLVAKRPTPTANAGLKCATGTFYSVQGTGLLQSVVYGDVSPLLKASDVSSFNGLGIGADGNTAYAYERTNSLQTVTMWFFDQSAGWTSTGDSYTPPDSTVNAFVTGAVDLATGDYYFGGFNSDATKFYLFKWVPSSGAFSPVGWVDISNGGGKNGDMAFDSNGNLYLVGSSDDETVVYSVTAHTLANASGTLDATGQLATAPSNPDSLTGSDGKAFTDVNGMAFNTTGSIYLGNDTTANEYDTSSWAIVGTKSVTSKLGTSTDLASCNSPANLTVQKNVAGRVSASDQFRLSVKSGTTESAYAETSGSSTGVQAAQIGPLPVIQGNTYNVSEAMAAGSVSSSSAYASALVCTSNGVNLTVTSGNVTIPNASGASVLCTFTNSPLVAKVTITKQMQDVNGANPQPRQGWTVGATATATPGSVSSSPTATTQATDSTGNAAWAFTFGSQTASATVAVQETQQSGYSFVSGSCTITKLNGTTSTTQLTGSSSQNLTGVAPGDSVACTYTNKPVPGATVTIKKLVADGSGANAKPASGWMVGAALSAAPGGVSISTPPTQTTGSDGNVPTPWAIAFPTSGSSTGVQVSETQQTGYVFLSGSCTITHSDTTTTPQSITSLPATLSGVKPGDAVACTFTNRPIVGAVTWTKVDANQPSVLLGGSQWTLTGPAYPQGTTVTDCVAASTAACAGADQDPAAGKFKVAGLTYGAYTLVETKAPVGFVLPATPTSIKFTISTDGTVVALDPIPNTMQTVPNIPLTGGRGTDEFLLLGGVLLALSGVGAWVARRRSRDTSRG